MQWICMFSSSLDRHTSLLPQRWHPASIPLPVRSCSPPYIHLYFYISLGIFCHLQLTLPKYLPKFLPAVHLCSLFFLFTISIHIYPFFTQKMPSELSFCNNPLLSLTHSHLIVFATWPCNTGSLIAVALLWGCSLTSHSAAGTVFLVLGSVDSPRNCSGSWKYESVINDAVSC